VSPDVDAAARALAAVHAARFVVAASALLVPVGVVVLLARWRVRGSRARRALLRTAGSLVAIVYGVLAAAAAADWAHRVEGPARGRLARALGAPIVDALDRYRADHHVYPTHLAQLVPTYLAAADYHAAERSPLAHPFELTTDGPRFLLHVRDAPPSPSRCLFASATRQWYCDGYF